MINVGDTVKIKGQDGERLRGIISRLEVEADQINVGTPGDPDATMDGMKRMTLTIEVIAGHGEVETKPAVVHAMGFDRLDLCQTAPRDGKSMLSVTPVMQQVTCEACRALLDRLADQVFVGCKACRDGIPH